MKFRVREIPHPFLTSVAPRFAIIEQRGHEWDVLCACELGGGELYYDPLRGFATKMDARGHAEMWCGLLSKPDPDTRPRWITVPQFSPKEAPTP